MERNGEFKVNILEKIYLEKIIFQLCFVKRYFFISCLHAGWNRMRAHEENEPQIIWKNNFACVSLLHIGWNFFIRNSFKFRICFDFFY